jgi:hypothetical protein
MLYKPTLACDVLLKVLIHKLYCLMLNTRMNNVVLHIGAGIIQTVQCLATDWTTGRSGFDPRQRQEDFSSSLCVLTVSEAHPASCPMGTGGPFPGAIKRPGRDADYLPPSSADVKNE